MRLVACYGGGVNSTAGLIEMHRRGLVPDAILFADTGGERPQTYALVEKFSGWLTARGMPAVTTVRVSGKTLEQDCLDRKALPSVAYGFKTCSLRWKVEPQEKWLNAWSGGEVYRKAVFFDAGEPQRAKPYQDAKCEVWYPLVEWGLDRDDCAAICADAGVCVGKSSCFFCPNSRRHEVADLAREEPGLFARAVAMEANANADLTAVKGLGRSWAWRHVTEQLPMFDVPRDMPCGCYDG